MTAMELVVMEALVVRVYSERSKDLESESVREFREREKVRMVRER